MARSTLRGALLAAVLLSLLTACGGSGSSSPITLPSRTTSLLPSRTATVAPSRTATALPTRDESTAVPQPTEQPTEQPTDQPTEQPTQAPTQPPPTQPTVGPTTRLTTRPTTGQESSAPATEASESASPSPEPGESDQADGGSDDISPWWWVALAAALVAGAVAVFLLVRRSRRRRWRADLAGAEEEVAWFARDLVPQLRGAGSLEGVTGGWAVAAPRVTALDDRLTQLVATAPTEDDRARAAAVQEAVRTARDRVAAVAASEASDTWSLDLDGAQAPLLAVLVPPASAGEQGPGPRAGQ